MRLRIALAVILSCSLTYSYSQEEDLLSSLGEETPQKSFVTAAFKSTRVIAGQSMEQVAPGVLDFRILHRFGRLNEGSYGAWGLDQATIRLGLDYGITKRLTVGLGRSSNRKEIDGFLKYRPVWQAHGKGGSPVSILFLGGVVKDGLKFSDPDRDNHYSSRFAYYGQVIIGRKFSEAFTLQLQPTVVHRNLVPTLEDEHDIISIGAGMRLKLSRRIALTAEYYHTLPDQVSQEITNPLSIGFDIETGGHVFQLHFTNALGMNERALIADTDGSWDNGDIHFGFNISRVFTIAKPKAFKANKSE